MNVEYVYDVVSSEFISKGITRIILRPSTESHLSYQAGQYIKVIHSDGESPLSIANAPDKKNFIELHLAHPHTNLPAKNILRVVADEKKLILRGPYGNCTIKELSMEQPVIFLARGTGFAPIKAIIEEVKTFKKYPPMHFYWSATSPEGFYMNELLAQWTHEIENFSYTLLLSRPHPHWRGKTGLLQDVVLEDYPEIAKYLVYVSAPEPIVHDVLHVFQKAGLPRDHYFSDVFDYV